MHPIRILPKGIVSALILILSLLLVCTIVFYSGLTVRHYSIATDRIGAGNSVRVVLLADLHGCIYGAGQERLIAKIRKQNPDIILLAGDMADDRASTEGMELLLDGVRDAAPAYYVSGNHEYWSGHINDIKDIIRGYGATVLEDEYNVICLNGVPLVVAGVDDPEWTRYEDKSSKRPMDESFRELSDKILFKILLAHRPEQIELYKSYSFDLVVSGHAHGGQVRIPFLLNGLIAPNQGLFPEYAGGIYKHDNLTHIVSRGLSFNPRLPRIFNPPEIVVIDIIFPAT